LVNAAINFVAALDHKANFVYFTIKKH